MVRTQMLDMRQRASFLIEEFLIFDIVVESSRHIDNSLRLSRRVVTGLPTVDLRGMAEFYTR
jgi:hypothetical protein